jgi:hypothetical protein
VVGFLFSGREKYGRDAHQDYPKQIFELRPAITDFV